MGPKRRGKTRGSQRNSGEKMKKDVAVSSFMMIGLMKKEEAVSLKKRGKNLKFNQLSCLDLVVRKTIIKDI